MKIKFRKLHRQLAPILFLPLFATVLTGFAYRVGKSWFSISNTAAETLLTIHQGEFVGKQLVPIYVLLTGLGLVGMSISGIVMLNHKKHHNRKFTPKKSESHQIHRLIAPILILPVVVTGITGIVYRLGLDWFGMSSEQAGIFLRIHQGTYLGSTLRVYYVFIVGLGLIALLVSGMRIITSRQRNFPQTSKRVRSRLASANIFASVSTRIWLGIILSSIALVNLLYTAIFKAISAKFTTSLTKIETRETRQAIDRFQKIYDRSIQENTSELSSFILDWSSKYSLANFVQKPTQSFLDNHFSPSEDALFAAKTDFIIFTNAAGEIVYGHSYDTEGQKQPIPSELQQYIQANPPIVNNEAFNACHNGLVVLPEVPVNLTSCSISTSQLQAEIKGSVLVGQFFDEELIDRLEDTVEFELNFYQFDTLDQLPNDLQNVYRLLTTKSKVVIQFKDESTVSGYTLISDIDGEPALMAQVDVPREDNQQEQQGWSDLLVPIGVIGLIFGIPAYMLADKLFQDWQQQQENQDILRELEAINRALLVAEAAIMLLIDEEGNCLEHIAPPEATSLLFDRDVVDKPLVEILPLEIAQKLMKYVDLALTARSTYIHQFQVSSEDRWQEYEARIIPISETKASIIIRNFTDLESIKTKSQKYSDLIESPINNNLKEFNLSSITIEDWDKKHSNQFQKETSPETNNEVVPDQKKGEFPVELSFDSLTVVHQPELAPIVTQDELVQILEATIADTKKSHVHHVFCYLSIEQYDLICDKYGLQAGEDVLTKFIEKVRSYLHFPTILARLENNYLGILLRYYSVEKALNLANHLHQYFHYFPFLSQGNQYPINIKFGWVEINFQSSDGSEIMNKAKNSCEIIQ